MRRLNGGQDTPDGDVNQSNSCRVRTGRTSTSSEFDPSPKARVVKAGCTIKTQLFRARTKLRSTLHGMFAEKDSNYGRPGPLVDSPA